MAKDTSSKEDNSPQAVTKQHSEGAKISAEDKPDTNTYDLSVGGVLSASWNMLTENIGWILGLTLLPVVVFMLIALFGVAIGVGGGGAVVIFIPIALILYIVGIALAIIGSAGVVAGLLAVFRDHEEMSFSKGFELGKQYAVPYFLVSLVVGLAIVGGLLLLIIPGIIFAIWFSLSIQSAIDQKLGVIDAMKESKRLISGNVGTLIAVVLVLMVISMVGSFIPILGVFISIAVGILTNISLVYMYLGFKQQKAGGVLEEHEKPQEVEIS